MARSVGPCFWLACTLLLCACPGPPPAAADDRLPSQAPEGFWSHWGDGQAELAGYRLVQPRYGTQRAGTAVLVTVTEDFTRSSWVKSDGGHGDELPVIKLNEMRDFTTGVYDYNVMTSSFLPLDGSSRRGLPLKISFSSQEWCGQVWEQQIVNGASVRRTIHSYFDGEADSDETGKLPAGAVFADTLPILARGLVGDLLSPGESREVPWMRSALDRRLLHQPASWEQARLHRSPQVETLETPAGTFEVERWTVEGPGSSSRWYVEKAAPRRLVGWDRDDGESGRLTGSFRSPYWKQSGEEHRSLRERLGLLP